MSNDSISFTEYTYLMNRIAYWLIANKKQFTVRSVYGYMNKAMEYCELVEKIKKNGENYQSDSLIAEFVECAIYDNKDLSFLPNYVSGHNGTKYYKNCFVSMANRVSAYEVLNGRSPAIVYIEDPKGNGTTSNTTDATLKKFTDKFGSVTDIDSCLAKIQGRGYAYYYNSQYNTQTTINRIYNKQGVNCTDASQLFYRLGLALGYEVQFIHIKCSGGDGHVRLRLKHPINTEGDWILRDPAAVLKGNGIRSNWCTSGYTLLAYDPSWIFSDLYQ